MFWSQETKAKADINSINKLIQPNFKKANKDIEPVNIKMMSNEHLDIQYNLC